MDFLAIKRNLRKDFSSFKQYKLGLLSDAAPQFLGFALRGMGFEFQLNLEIYEANIGSTWQEINGHGGLYATKPNGVFIYSSLPIIQAKFYKTESESRKNFATDFLAEFEIFVNILAQNNVHQVFANLFIVENDAVFGQFGMQSEVSFTFQLQKINVGLSKLAIQNPSISLLKLPHDHFDPKLYYSSQADISFEALPKVAESFMQSLLAKNGQTKKCLVLDLDNTIWGGIVGDDGWENLELGQLGRGKVFVDIQLWLRELKNRGILLAVCSKNEEQTAKSVFQKHPEMVLQLSDIALFVANWNPKSENIRFISKTLNIGLESFVFLDDNVAERELVKTTLPEISVPHLPQDPVEWLAYLRTQNLFETSGLTKEDFSRTEKYKQEFNRKQETNTHARLEDYLLNLEMKVKVLPIDSFTLPRVAQLLQRTNQFNLRTIRHSETEIKTMLESGYYSGFALSLQDKFGDEGIVSAVLLEKKHEYYFINTWIMSCRVFERTLEYFVFNLILEEAKKNATILKTNYLPTPKNQYIKNLLPDLGFKQVGDFFEIEPNKENFKSHFITQI